jgi:hypothetical protein
VSLPVPAAQPLVAVIVFAAVIASRKTQMPGAPISASESTVIVAACTVALSINVSAATIPAAKVLHILNSPPSW